MRIPWTLKHLLRVSICLLIVPTIVVSADNDRQATSFLNNGVTAHRGFSGEYAENTLRAFEAGILAGADWLECDIYMTADGKLVVVHDVDTKRVAERNLVVAKSSWARLASLDVAYQFRKTRGLSLRECPEARMPLLEDVIHLVMKQKRTRLSIQPKQDIVDEAVALVRELEAEEWIGFNEGSFVRVSRVKELSPKIPVFYDTNGIDTKLHVERALVTVHTLGSNDGAGWFARWAWRAVVRYSKALRFC